MMRGYHKMLFVAFCGILDPIDTPCPNRDSVCVCVCVCVSLSRSLALLKQCKTCFSYNTQSTPTTHSLDSYVRLFDDDGSSLRFQFYILSNSTTCRLPGSTTVTRREHGGAEQRQTTTREKKKAGKTKTKLVLIRIVI